MSKPAWMTADLHYHSFNQQLNYEETQKLNVKKKEKPLTLEEAYKEVQTIDIGDWENKRVPRPWSEDK